MEISSPIIPTFISPQKTSIFIQSPLFPKPLTFSSPKFPTKNFIKSSHTNPKPVNPLSSSPNPSPVSSPTKFYGLCYVLGDDIDTNQIIPPNFSSLNPSNPQDYKMLGSYVFEGLSNSYPLRFVDENGFKSKYSVIISGNNFGCGSKNELAVVALNSAGVKAVVAESYDGNFLKNLISNGKILSLLSEVRICNEFKTGDVATIDVGERVLVNETTGKVFMLKNIC
ncbi:unnamed protein product [Amaranthus hypochondriacus]